MRKRIVFIFHFLLSIFHFSFSQNLVPNYSFEDTIKCPGTISDSKGWYSPTMSTPDYFHSCNTSGLGVPKNFIGFQYARTGEAYAGIGTYLAPPKIPDFRDYIQTFLTNSLQSGKLYCVVFYVNLLDTCKYAIDGMGAYISSTTVSSTNFTNLPYVPQISNLSGKILDDTLAWAQIKGSFIANGGEKYITIGNFKNDNNTGKVIVNNITSVNESYYYIDDIYLYEQQNADAGADNTICKGDEVQLGTQAAYGMQYSWSPAAGLDNPGIVQPQASPTATTTYIVTITDTIGANCVGKGSDTVTVYVKNTPMADAGTDSSVCQGKTIVLGAPVTPGYSYSWEPTTGLSDPFAAQPLASLSQSTAYLLKVTDNASGCSDEDTVTVTVKECSLLIPTIIKYNELFEIKNLPENSQLKIYNTLGQLIYSSKNYNNEFAAWMVESGTYIYRLHFPDGKEKQGRVTVTK